MPGSKADGGRNASASRPVFFVDRLPKLRSGSSYLRTTQLWELSKDAFAEAGIRSQVTSGFAHRGSVLILNKNTLLATKSWRLRWLKRQNNILVADPLDGKIAAERLRCCDLLLAASLTQHDALRTEFPDKRIAYVGHHVDLRLPPVDPPADAFRLGYFGEIGNAAFSGYPDLPVEFVAIATARADLTDWMARLAAFNAHYALRNTQTFDGFKPFTKGFVAAHCGSPILVGGDDIEARRHLPADYPFVADTSSVESVTAAIARMRDAFGGPDWRKALEAMAELRRQTAPDAIAGQLVAAVAPLALTARKQDRGSAPASGWIARLLRRPG